MPINFENPDERKRVTRNVVMLTENWGGWTTGIASINQALASSLSSYTNIVVYCVVLATSNPLESDHLPDEPSSTVIDSETGLSVPVQLIHVNLLAASAAVSSTLNDDSDLEPSSDEMRLQVRYALEQFNDKTIVMLAANGEIDLLPNTAAYVIGYAPSSARAALMLRQSMYQDGQAIIFFHSIPDEQEWTASNLPLPVLENEDMLRIGEAADVIYSVTPKIHAHYETLFRSSARVVIDHRLLTPLCAKNLFDINGSALKSNHEACFCMAVFASGEHVDAWMGIDIAICAAGKVAKALSVRRDTDGNQKPTPGVQLTVLNISSTKMNEMQDVLQQHTKTADKHGAHIVFFESPSDPWQAGPHRQLTAGACFDLCLVPTRSEPYGQVGLEAVSAGLPTLLSECSSVASIIRRLTTEPEKHVVKTTQNVAFVRQDGAAWCERILGVIDNFQDASERALILQGAMRRDEETRNTHDNFMAHCLGGIGVRFQLTDLQFVSPPSAETEKGLPPSQADGPRELKTRRQFNSFLLAVLRQSWRAKRHPLQSVDELPVLLNSMPQLPIGQLIAKVVDALEENDRRIVAIDCEKESLMIYCPDIYALRDLWAMCDRINRLFRSVMMPLNQNYSTNVVMVEYGLRQVGTRVVISGPEYLQYKNNLMELLDQYSSISI